MTVLPSVIAAAMTPLEKTSRISAISVSEQPRAIEKQGPLAAGAVGAQLEVAATRARELDDEGERLLQEGLDLVLRAELEELAVEVALARDAFERGGGRCGLREAVGAGHEAVPSWAGHDAGSRGAGPRANREAIRPAPPSLLCALRRGTLDVVGLASRLAGVEATPTGCPCLRAHGRRALRGRGRKGCGAHPDPWAVTAAVDEEGGQPAVHAVARDGSRGATAAPT